jgi:hypothetical protein
MPYQTIAPTAQGMYDSPYPGHYHPTAMPLYDPTSYAGYAAAGAASSSYVGSTASGIMPGGYPDASRIGSTALKLPLPVYPRTYSDLAYNGAYAGAMGTAASAMIEGGGYAYRKFT